MPSDPPSPRASSADTAGELRAIWEISSEAMRITDRDGIIRRVNPAFCRLFALPEDSLLGRPMHVTYAPGREDHYLSQHLSRFSTPPSAPEIEVDLTLHDGRQLWAIIAHRVLPTDANRPPLLLTTFRDITDRKRTELALRERERLLGSINQNLVGSFVYRIAVTPDGRRSCHYVSPNIEDITGIPPDAFLANVETFYALLLSEDQALLRDHIAASNRSGAPLDIEVRFTHPKNNDLRWLRLHGRPVEVLADGTAIREGIATDITSAKATLAENRQLALVVSRTVNGVVLTDARRRIQWVNDGFTRVTGYTLPEVIGRVPGDILQGPETDPAIIAQIRAALRALRGITVELVNYAKGGRKYWVEVEIQPLRDDSGRLTHFMAIEKDITDRKTAAAALAESQSRFAALFADNPVATCLVALSNGETLDANRRFLDLFGGLREDILGQPNTSLNLLGDGTPEAWAGFSAQLTSQHWVTGIERTLSLPVTGRRIDLSIAAQRVELDGRPCALLSFLDITARKQAENEVRRLNASLETQVRQRTETLALSEERFRLLAENLRDLLCLIDEAGRFAYTSPSFLTVLHYQPEDLLGTDPLALVHPDDRPNTADALRLVLDGGPPQSREFRFRHKAGHYVWLEAVGSPMRLPDGRSRGCVVAARDITERREAAMRLRDSEQRYADLVENVHDAIVRSDLEGHIVFANHRFVEWFGLSDRDLYTVNITDHAAADWTALLRHRLERQTRGDENPEHFEYEGVRPDGSRLWLDALIVPLLEQERIVGTQAVLRDITARKQAEQASQTVLGKTALVVGDDFYRILTYELGRALGADVVCIARLAGHRRLRSLAHYSSGRMLESAEFEIHAGHPCDQAITSGEPLSIESGIRTSFPAGVLGRNDIESYYGHPLRKGDRPVQGLLIIASTHPLRFEPLQLSLLNILAARTEAEFLREQAENEKTEVQARLFQSQKYEALGTLAGGVAHDFNNILTGVLNYTALAEMDCPPTHPQIAEYLGEVLKCAHRAKELVRQILLFSRAEGALLEPLLVQKVVREALSLLRSTIPAGIEIKGDIDETCPSVRANATQIHQIVMNLGINAAQAMPDQKGEISVRLLQRHVAPSELRRLPGLKPGPHILLEVADNGCGIEPAVLGRIFEPFFTTKKVGEGTGLGLSVVHSVVQNHGGAIAVRSQPGNGTTFEIFLPVHGAEQAASPSAGLASLPSGAGRRLLVIDDEAAVGRSLKLALERLDYSVTAIFHPVEALALFQRSPRDFDAVITDLQMPDMAGIDLARELLAHRPDLPVFVASGFAGKVQASELRSLGVRAFLQKPIDLEHLARLLAELPPPSSGTLA